MTTPHKWAKEIKAWADGKKIEYRSPQYGREEWRELLNPGWTGPGEYRVKPEQTVRRDTYYADSMGRVWNAENVSNPSLGRITVDWILEDGKPVDVKLVKN